MELQHAFAFTSIVIDMQHARLQPLAASRRLEPRGAPAPRHSRGLAPTLIAGLLVLILVTVA